MIHERLVLAACYAIASIFVGVLLALPSSNLAITEVDTRIRVIYGILQTATLLPFAALGLFMSNRTLFNSERASELYGSGEYYLAGFVMEVRSGVALQ